MPEIRITEATIKTLTRKEGDVQTDWWDSGRGAIRGFGVRVGATAMTFFVRRRVDGKPVRTTLGRYPDMSVRDARALAESTLGTMADGIDPNEAKREAEGPTLQEALDFHVGKMEAGENRRGKKCSPRSIRTLRGTVELHLADYLDRPLLDLTADVLDRVRASIEREAERVAGSNPENRPGVAVGNRLLANVSAIWRSWHKRHGLPVTCPVERLTSRALEPRDNRIPDDGFASWYAKVMALENGVRRDLQLMALFTGVRTEGIRNLRWDDIDEDQDVIQIRVAKGDKPYTIPLTDTVREILERRRAENLDRDKCPAVFLLGQGDGGWVFPSVSRDGEHVIAVAEVKERETVYDEDGDPVGRVSALPGVQACRKTYNSVAAEIGCPQEVRERLLNHSGRGVNVKSYTFVHDGAITVEWSRKIEAALWERIRDTRPAKGRGKLRIVRRVA